LPRPGQPAAAYRHRRRPRPALAQMKPTRIAAVAVLAAIAPVALAVWYAGRPNAEPPPARGIDISPVRPPPSAKQLFKNETRPPLPTAGPTPSTSPITAAIANA